MMTLVYSESSRGIIYDFTYGDYLIDFLLGLHARPFIEIGFMPLQLASDNSKVFWWRGNASATNDRIKWLNLVEAFVRHLL